MRIDEFILARVAEDERDADVATLASSAKWVANNSLLMYLDSERYAECLGSVEHYRQDPAWYHVARHDPARVLAECEAKRRIVELWQEFAEWPVEMVMYALAAIYADHPDFDPAWRL